MTGALVASGAVVTVVHGGAEAAPGPGATREQAGVQAVAAPPVTVRTSSIGSRRGTSAPTGAPALPKPAATAGSTSVPTKPLRHGSPVHVVATSNLLARPTHGQAAVDALGGRIHEAARRSGVSAGRLRQLLTTDSTAWVGRNGSLFYLDPAAHRVEAGAATTSGPSTTARLALPADQTFKLHSNPGSTHKIFLDMDGAYVSGTGWNYNGLAAGSVAGVNGGGSTFTEAQDAWIQEVWRQVSEDYAPFDIDVTTEDPGVAGYTRSSDTDTAYGTHVVFTMNSATKSKLCNGVNCLGLAMVGTFDLVDSAGVYQPAWVFADATTNATIAAQGAAHEAGHTLGLSHDGTKTAGAGSYYAGTAAWGPIMGFATNRALSQWSKGEYADANETQDDLAVIAANGAPLKADDHGDTTATADQLGAATSYAATGIISTRTDVDVFAVDRACTGTFTASASGIGAQTALDLSLSLRDSTGAQVAFNNPASGNTGGSWPQSTGMNAAISTTLGAGRYYLTVDGVGAGDPTKTGYSDYASLGQYTLAASGCSAATASPTTPAPSITPTPTPSPTGSPSTAPVTAPEHPPTVTVSASPTTPPVTIPALSRPGAPRIGSASSGSYGGSVTATARWTPPLTLGGAPITRYRVAARKLDSRNRTVATYYASSYSAPTARSLSMRLPRGRYQFVVMAWNSVGASTWSSASRIVTAR
ncbi:M12 family metallo-peptidase [Nocardioides korecus]